MVECVGSTSSPPVSSVVTSGGDIRNFTFLEPIDSTFAISPAVVQLGDDDTCESPAVVQLGDNEPVRRPGPYRGLGVVNTGDGLARGRH